ncbi:MAG TPA: PKD domain-containing protein [Chitinophagales bacterium]|nr:PKD domain-containing protein [Chitinophagales bacterium]
MNISTKSLLITCAITAFLLPLKSSSQIFCKLNGNVIIYSNYDGGYLNINVDQHIPNLKIGVTTYEDCEINISGTYASDVTEVIYAGYQGDNQHCNPSPPTTSVVGVSGNIVTVLLYPTATWTNAYGYPYIICNFQCDSASYQGGCNTPDQISHYYLTQFGGLLYYHFTQYNCWQGTYNVSDGGNCCIGENIIPPQYSVIADFISSADTLCAEEGIVFTNNSYNSYPGSPLYNWDFGDGSPNDTSTDASHGYSTPGSYTVTLTITDSSGIASDTQTMVITVIDCGTGVDGINFSDWFSIQPNPAHDEIVCRIPQELSFPANLELIDETGRTRIMKLVETTSSGDRKIILDVHELPRGMYLLRINGSGYSLRKKMMIE